MPSSKGDVESISIMEKTSNFTQTHDIQELPEAIVPNFDKIQEREILWKIDLHLIPILTLLYLLSFLDRVNLGNARNLPNASMGLQSSLHMTSEQYNTALSIFFVGYILFELPSNLILKKLTPRIWLSSIMVVWSLIMIFMSLSQSFSGIVASRVFLGVAEAGLFPGIMYYMTLWYRRHEIFFRMAIVYSAATLAGAFGGFIAYGIGHLEGVAGMSAWRWLFMIEGLISLVVALSAFLILENFPHDARFLTHEEREFVIRRLEVDAKEAGSKEFNWHRIISAWRDWKVIIMLFQFLGVATPIYAFAFFTPTILNNLTTHTLNVQWLSAIPYCAAFVSTMIMAFISDRIKQRGIPIGIMLIVSIIGYTILLITTNTKVEYAAVFICLMGIPFSVIGVITWSANNLAGDYKRATGMASFIAFGNVGGAIAGQIYQTRDSPFYRPGHAASLSFLIMAFITTIIMYFGLRYENQKRRRMIESGEADIYLASLTKDEISNLGDKHPNFIYTL